MTSPLTQSPRPAKRFSQLRFNSGEKPGQPTPACLTAIARDPERLSRLLNTAQYAHGGSHLAPAQSLQ